MSIRQRRSSGKLEDVSGENAHKPAARTTSGTHVDALRQNPSALVDYAFILSLVFGGCCTNVWAYERLLKINPSIGSALTFSQMLFITAQALPTVMTWNAGGFRLKPRQVPIRLWALQVLVLTVGSLLNNWAYAFQVPLTVQIVMRSAGLAVSMLFGYLFLGKRYSMMQIMSAALVTAGIVLVALSRPPGYSNNPAGDMSRYLIGLSMLTLSLFLTGYLGILQEKTYKTYGPCWREGLFYTHSLALPLFLFFGKDVKQGINSLAPSGVTSPWSYLILGTNLISQLICVSGVNKLTSQVSSVSTNLVLTMRKAISLCFSIWWFGNGWNYQLGLGACLVFAGSFAFSI
ncbi:hypothetical protein PLICRDRAFT_144289 [Plicaturopsis crispa FD-325 SS-3]|nr:hypothetical protein PLICRDRAFT_144289 [Plicaturopsis crispa FD-325 SS-3]